METREEILRKIEELPKGGITYKTIKGKRYPYLQWREDGKQRSRVLKPDEVDYLEPKIKERKALEEQLKKLDRYELSNKTVRSKIYEKDQCYKEMYFFEGNELMHFIFALPEQKRQAFNLCKSYLDSTNNGKVCILYGLRRTGKTTVMQQLIKEMNEEMFSKTVWIQASSSLTLHCLYEELARSLKKGIRFVFIDEATTIPGMMEGIGFVADLFATQGMKIIMTGSDSYCFKIAEEKQLFDRCVFVPTTLETFSEAHSRDPKTTLHDFIRQGGIFTRNSFQKYLSVAVKKNIRHARGKNMDERVDQTLHKIIDRSNEDLDEEMLHILREIDVLEEIYSLDLHKRQINRRWIIQQPFLSFGLKNERVNALDLDLELPVDKRSELKKIWKEEALDEGIMDRVLLETKKAFPSFTLFEINDGKNTILVLADQEEGSCRLVCIDLAHEPNELDPKLMEQIKEVFGTIQDKQIVFEQNLKTYLLSL